MELIERKIGETFEFEGKKIEVKAASSDECDGCFFNTKCTRKSKKLSGECDRDWRNDGKSVIFVEQQEKIEEIKERKVGEIFEYEGKKLKVEEKVSSDCYGCFFDEQHILCSNKALGYCGSEFRTDKKEIIFVEATEQNQTEQPQKLNFCEILKNCPQGEIFWSPLLGYVKFHDINQKRNFIVISLESGETWDINADGTITFGNVTSPEIMFYPSREQRDWSKFIAPWYKKERFNPKTLQTFDKVLSRNSKNITWSIDYFSHMEDIYKPYQFFCLSDNYTYCIPYNDDTKHLVGTKNEAPDFYKYWEE